MSNTATLINAQPPNGVGAVWHLYRLNPPLAEGHEYVIVSAANVPFSGPETYIFPADESGQVTDWGELPGSFKGGQDHATALHGAGYEVTA